MRPNWIECPNCCAQIPKGDLVWPLPRDFIDSLVPGDEVPAGMCPICDDPICEGDLNDVDPFEEDSEDA